MKKLRARNGRNQRRVDDAIRAWLTPVLIAIVIFFVKPVFDKFPGLENKLDVMAVQQQTLSKNIDDLKPQVQNAVTKIEVLDAKVTRIEKKVD